MFGRKIAKSLIGLIKCNSNINSMSVNFMSKFDQLRISIHKKIDILIIEEIELNNVPFDQYVYAVIQSLMDLIEIEAG